MLEADSDDLPAVLLRTEAVIDVLLAVIERLETVMADQFAGSSDWRLARNIPDDLFADWPLMEALRPTHMFYLLLLDAGGRLG